MSLLGFDISHHNGIEAVVKFNDQFPENSHFYICKASEGITYEDPYFNYFADTVLSSGKLLGAYHYCRPENGNYPTDEAENFITQITPYLGKCLLAVDYEGEALKVGQNWLLEFCNHVYNRTGVKPVVYLQYSELKNYKAVADAGFGLWVAKWGERPVSVAPWKFFAIWQTTNRFNSLNLDSDLFNGTEDQFKAYCKIESESTDDEKTLTINETMSLLEKSITEEENAISKVKGYVNELCRLLVTK